MSSFKAGEVAQQLKSRDGCDASGGVGECLSMWLATAFQRCAYVGCPTIVEYQPYGAVEVMEAFPVENTAGDMAQNC